MSRLIERLQVSHDVMRTVKTVRYILNVIVVLLMSLFLNIKSFSILTIRGTSGSLELIMVDHVDAVVLLPYLRVDASDNFAIATLHLESPVFDRHVVDSDRLLSDDLQIAPHWESKMHFLE